MEVYMATSTATFDVTCFATDSNRLIDFWEKVAFYLDGDLTYRKSGVLRNKISFKMNFNSKNESKFEQYYAIFKDRYDGACC